MTTMYIHSLISYSFFLYYDTQWSNLKLKVLQVAIILYVSLIMTVSVLDKKWFMSAPFVVKALLYGQELYSISAVAMDIIILCYVTADLDQVYIISVMRLW